LAGWQEESRSGENGWYSQQIQAIHDIGELFSVAAFDTFAINLAAAMTCFNIETGSIEETAGKARFEARLASFIADAKACPMTEKGLAQVVRDARSRATEDRQAVARQRQAARRSAEAKARNEAKEAARKAVEKAAAKARAEIIHHCPRCESELLADGTCPYRYCS
jgi:ABC-type branched-subunit amino acid transport system ATPase component